MNKEPFDDKKIKKTNERAQNYVRYSAVGFQMMGIILVGVFGGYYLDRYLGWKFPLFTLLLSLLSIAAAMYFLFKETGRKT